MNNTPLKYILLDWDGCLANTLPIWMESYQHAFSKNGMYKSENEIVQNAFGRWDGPKRMGVANNEKFIIKLLEEVDTKLPTAPLHKNVKEVLQELKAKGYNLGLVTTSLRKSVTPALKFHDIYKLFTSILGKEDVTNYKPDPEIIFKSLQIMQGDLNETIIVGDSDKDIKAGQNAKIKTCVFYPKENERFYKVEEVKSWNADHIIQDFRSVLTFL